MSGRNFSVGDTSQKIEERIGYKFKNESLLSQALTHASSATVSATYERLEFVGDAVLGKLVFTGKKLNQSVYVLPLFPMQLTATNKQQNVKI